MAQRAVGRQATYLPQTENNTAISTKDKMISSRPALGDIGNNVTSKTTKSDLVALSGALAQSSLKDHKLLKGSLKPDTTKEKSKQTSKRVIPKSVETSNKLPPHIENIDDNDGDNIFLLPEYVNDIYDYLRSLELKYPVNKDFLAGSNVIPNMRSVLVDWIIEVHMEYNLLPETLHLSVGILDRYLQAEKKVSKEDLQLVGICAMLIAGKYEETFPVEVGEFVYISDSAYTPKQVLKTEQVLLKKLDFCLSRPISLVFLRRFSKVGKAEIMHHTFGKYFLELALLDYSLAHVRPSLLAAVAFFISLCVVGNGISAGLARWTPTLCYFSKYQYTDMEPIIPIFANIIKQASHNKSFRTVHSKYASTKLFRVSNHYSIQENSDVLNQLINI